MEAMILNSWWAARVLTMSREWEGGDKNKIKKKVMKKCIV
jgi:hypothetical protein